MRLMGIMIVGMLALAGCEPRSSEGILEAQGEQLYQDNACASCHSVDGSKSVGPTWKGLFGSPVKLTDGSDVIADEEYLRESMLQPSLKTVDGFKPGLMETVIKQDSLSDSEVSALIAYIKSLR